MSPRPAKPTVAPAGPFLPGDAISGALLQISEAARNALDLDDLFPVLHRIVGTIMPARNFFIALYEQDNENREYLTFPYFVDEHDPPPQGREPLEDTLTGYVIRNGEPLLVDHNQENQMLAAGAIERVQGTDCAIWLGIPLQTHERIIGAVVMQSYDRCDEYGEREKQILSFVAGQIAGAIELIRYRMHLEEMVRQRTGELFAEKRTQEVLYEISQAVYSQGGVHNFLLFVQAQIGRLMDARNFYVALYKPETDKYHFPFFSDEYDNSEPQRSEDLHHTLTDWVRRNGPLLADRTVHEQLIKDGEAVGIKGTDSKIWLGVPLLVPGRKEAFGVMVVQSYDDCGCYGEREKRILISASTTVALAIDRIQLIADLFHHFNNAVTGIRGNAEILLRARAVEKKRQESLQEMLRQLVPGNTEKDRESLDLLQSLARQVHTDMEKNNLRLEKIIDGIEEATARMNRIYSPLLFGGRESSPS